MELHHKPVLLAEVLCLLRPGSGGHYIDGTIGEGGHTEALLKRSAPHGRVLGIDLDPEALARVERRLAGYVKEGRLLLAQGNFADLERIAAAYAFGPVQGILLDLGFSSLQVDDARRGFSFSADGPLDMRFDPGQALSAADIVNRADERELAGLFRRYGEERYARQIARRLVRERARAPITRTTQLAEIVAAALASTRPQGPREPLHPATRVFQALRIAVNHELENLERALPQMLNLLSSATAAGNDGGRMVVIAFHSLEDRIVKEFMKREATDCLCPPRTPVCICGHRARLRLLTPRALRPTSQEVQLNPRARSARLRAAEKVVGS
jgi:16S rRNA (cytosine1402-N4)-methyltransferase